MNTDTIPTPAKRPRRTDDAVIAAVAEKLMPAVQQWLKQGGYDDDEPEQVLAELKSALRWDTDGYKVARNLNDWEPDSRLVEILDAADGHARAAQAKLAEEWLKTSGLVAPAIGAKVRWKSRKGDAEGEVTRNYPDGRACVCSEALGHVREGMGTNGEIVAWEDLKPAPATA